MNEWLFSEIRAVALNVRLWVVVAAEARHHAR